MARSTIDRGLAELRGDAAPAAAPERVRRQGGGRRPLVVTDPTLLWWHGMGRARYPQAKQLLITAD